MSSQIEFTFGLATELEHQLPTFARLLNTTPDNIFFSSSRFDSFCLNEKQDIPIHKEGSTPNLPYILETRFHDPDGFALRGYGFILYKCSHDEKLFYVKYTTKTAPNVTMSVYACKKGDCFKIKRSAKRLLQKSLNQAAPILKPGLIDEIVRSSIWFIRNKKKLKEFGIPVKRGLLFDGPPGNGKTLMCSYISRLCTKYRIDQWCITASELEKNYKDNTLSQLLSRQGVLFFDDVDISFFSRGGGDGRMACSLLSAMDGIDKRSDTIRIFSTNEHIEDLDPAFVRPGRIDRRFTFEKPNKELRLKLIQTWSCKIIDNIDVDKLATETEGCSFAELDSVKTTLVNGFLISGGWDMNSAVDSLKRDGQFKKTGKLGFVNE